MNTQPINTPDRARGDEPAELDPGMVEKARAAFEAMTKAMLDAGRRYEERMNAATTAALSAANVPGLVAEVERLRYDLDHSYSQREWSALTARATSAEQERDRLRAGIEGLAGDPTAQDETGTWIDRKRVADLLAGPGERLGEHVHRTSGIDDAEDCPDILGGAAHCSNPQEADDGQWEDLTRPAPVGEQPGECDRSGEWCRTHREAWPCPAGLMAGMLTTDDAASPAPVVPDSPDVYETIRAFIEEEVGFDGGPGMDDQARRLTDRVLAVVGQGVTAETAWDEGLRAGEAVERARWQWSAGATARAVNGLTERPERPSNPYRAAVRPTGQEQVDG